MESSKIQLGSGVLEVEDFELTSEDAKFDVKDWPHLDSPLEGYFDWWCAEAIRHGLLADVKLLKEYNLLPPIIEHRQKRLKTKSKWIKKQITRGVKMTPDRVLFFKKDDLKQAAMVDTFFKSDDNQMIFYDSSPKGFFKAQQWGDYYISVIDIKPPVITMRQLSGSTFTIKQQMMWAMNGAYVQKCVLFPSKSKILSNFLFTGTFFPDRYFITDKNGKPRSIKWSTKNVHQYLKSI